MEKSISIRQFIQTIRALPSDKPINDPEVWYLTQKEHWLGWLSQYHGPGAYGRKTDIRRDAKFAYNHIACPQMLLWIIKAAKVPTMLQKAAHRDSDKAVSLHGECAAIRKNVPWSELYKALWGKNL
jgi:hypothetical protein